MDESEGRVSHALIAEDDDEDFEIFSTAVGEVSIAIVLSRVTNGFKLMSRLKDEESLPDVLFLDLQIPLLPGSECLKLIRANKEYDSLPIIMFSGSSDPSEIDYCFREGSNFFLQKPNSVGQLVEHLEKIFTIDWRNMYYPPISQFVLPNRKNDKK